MLPIRTTRAWLPLTVSGPTSGHNGLVITPARPTLRCLRADLTQDWDESADQRLVQAGQAGLTKSVHSLDHKIIRKAVQDFPLGVDVDKKRENITGLTDPFFWKVKTDRWRGAVYVDQNDQPWLVAAGLRYEGESRDFYKQFMSGARSDPSVYLPTVEDREVLLREVNETLILEREAHLRDWALQKVREARSANDGFSQGSLTFTSRDGRTHLLAKVTFLLAKPETPGDPFGLLVELEITNWEFQALWEWDEQVILAAICSCEGSWGTTQTSTRMHSIDLATEDDLEATCRGERGADTPGHMTPGSATHTVHRQRLTESTVEGLAVKAVCGKWFVPRQDHASLPPCQTCETLNAYMGINPRIDQESDR